MAVLWIVLIAVGVIVAGIVLYAVASTVIDSARSKKDPTYLDRKMQKLQGGIELDQERIRRGDERIRRNDESIARNNAFIAEGAKHIATAKEFLAKNDKSMKNIAQLKLLIQRGIFTSEEQATIEQLANNPIFDEFTSLTNATADALEEDIQITEAHTKLQKEVSKVILGDLGGSVKSDVKLLELDEKINEYDERSKRQKEKVLELEERALEYHPKMETIDAEIARWLALGQSRLK